MTVGGELVVCVGGLDEAGGGGGGVAGGAELVVGDLVVPGGEELVGGSEAGGAVDDVPEDGGPLVGPGAELLGPELLGPEPLGPGLPEPEDGPDGDEPEGVGVGVVEVDGSRVDGADPEPPELPGGVDVVGPSDDPSELPPATLSVTYSPNRSSVPAGGSDAVTRAPSGGSPPPSNATASPLSASSRLACPNVAPARSGTARRSRVSKAVSFSPVVPTGRVMPRSGSWTSTRASRSTFRVAGRTATTEDFS
ncbi:hypothetical protein SCHAM137S_01899 [Streptomyces chartreusis]